MAYSLWSRRNGLISDPGRCYDELIPTTLTTPWTFPLSSNRTLLVLWDHIALRFSDAQNTTNNCDSVNLSRISIRWTKKYEPDAFRSGLCSNWDTGQTKWWVFGLWIGKRPLFRQLSMNRRRSYSPNKCLRKISGSVNGVVGFSVTSILVKNTTRFRCSQLIGGWPSYIAGHKLSALKYRVLSLTEDQSNTYSMFLAIAYNIFIIGLNAMRCTHHTSLPVRLTTRNVGTLFPTVRKVSCWRKMTPMSLALLFSWNAAQLA